MRKTSLASAKAHLSSLVDEAEHHRRRIVILRHGKPAAAIVPLDAPEPNRRRHSPAEIRRIFSGLGSGTSARASAVADLLDGRR